MRFAVQFSNWKPKYATCYAPTEKVCFKRHFVVSCFFCPCKNCTFGFVNSSTKRYSSIVATALCRSSPYSNNRRLIQLFTSHGASWGRKSIQFIGKRQFWSREAAEGASYSRLSDSNPPNHDLSDALVYISSQTNVVYIKIDLFGCLLNAHTRFRDLSLDWKRIRFNSAACGQLKKCETDSLSCVRGKKLRNWVRVGKI